jgi:hypothetical protein
VPAIAATLAFTALAAAHPAAMTLSSPATATWAHERAPGFVHRARSGRSPVIDRLRAHTEIGDREVYLLLSKRTDSRGREWVHLRLPGQPNGRTGWVLRSALGPLHTTHTALVVDRRKLTATLLVSGRARWRVRVGIGAPATPTPAGSYYVRELVRTPPAGPYGPYAFGTSAYSHLSDWPGGGIIGVHGTNEPALIPGRPSHGCVRMRNSDIRYLVRHLPIGAPVRIR